MKYFTIIFIGIASFAQERIFFDEQIRFSNKIAIYNELIVLRIIQGSLSIDRLLRAFRFLLSKHKILRTSLIFTNDDTKLQQCITNNHQTFTLTNQQTFKNDNELQNIIYQTIINPTSENDRWLLVIHCCKVLSSLLKTRDVRNILCLLKTNRRACNRRSIDNEP